MLANAEARWPSKRDWDGAIAAYDKILTRAPNEPYTLGAAVVYAFAAGNYRRADGLRARCGSHWNDGCEDSRRAVATPAHVQPSAGATRRALRRAGPPARMPIPLLIAAGAQLSYLNLPERAIEYLDEAKRADPNYPTTLLARTQILTHLGRFDDAEQDGSAPFAGRRKSRRDIGCEPGCGARLSSAITSMRSGRSWRDRDVPPRTSHCCRSRFTRNSMTCSDTTRRGTH